MNGIKIRFSVEGSKDPHDKGVILAVVCCDKHYDFLNAEAIEDVKRAVIGMCKANRFKGWKVANFKIKSMEVE